MQVIPRVEAFIYHGGRRMEYDYNFDPFDDFHGEMKLPITNMTETSGIGSSSWMPKYTLSKHQLKSGRVILSHDTVQTYDNSSTFGNGCDRYLKSSHRKSFPLLLQTVKDDYSSIFETTDRRGNNVFKCLECYDSRPPSLLMQNPQTMKITRIFRGIYILFIAIRAMKSSRTLEYDGLDNNFEGVKIFQHLKLEELSDRLHCFCSLWPPNFEFDKDKCIQLWVAQGFFDFEFGRRIEVVANDHFEDMLKKNFIVQSRFCIAKENMMYKVDNVASSSSLSWVRGDKLSSIAKEVQHLFLLSENIKGVSLRTLVRFRQLRTLILSYQHGNSIKHIPYDFKLPHLRILDLHGTRISSLPESIGDLVSLRYLDVSETRIEYLPETIGGLRYLQILKLQCSKFRKLPECTNKLINLRHLDLDIVHQLNSVPVGMGNLTSLQTLKGFIVGKNEGRRGGELKHLNDLSGSLQISGLDEISSVEEAREVELYKKHLNKLELLWGHSPVDFVPVEDIFECLQPHLSLKELIISSYHGSRFPTWMSNSYLPNIVSITLLNFSTYSYLPYLGGLQSLKSLCFDQMWEVRSIDSNFCRYRGRQIGPAFPKLEKLSIVEMPQLESWTGVENGDFPCLLELKVSFCPKLIAIPKVSLLSTLKILSIFMCGELRSLAKGKFPSKLERLEITKCPLVSELLEIAVVKHIPSIIIDGVKMPPELYMD